MAWKDSKRRSPHCVRLGLGENCLERLCCCLTLTLVKNLESVVTQRCWSPRKISEKPNEIKIRPGNTTLSRLKRTIRRRRTSEKVHVHTELTWPRVSTQLQHSVPPFPQLTNTPLQTTAVGLPEPYEPHGNREHRRMHLPSGVLSE